MSLTVLSVAYPLAPVSTDTAGGAEQVLSMLDRALVAAGHRSLVVARADSRVAGELVPVEQEPGTLHANAVAAAQARHERVIADILRREAVDLVHLHGIDFPAYLPAPGVPVLATLHLPPSWYPDEIWQDARPATWLNCVSDTQRAACPPSPRLVRTIPNGVDVNGLQARHAKRGFALFVGRICPEKGVHLAIDAAKLAGVPLLIAGEVFPYPEHARYFDEEVRPRLDSRRRFVGPIGFTRKRRLLSSARCLLVPALAEETSSLVVREAAACGTPAIAFPQGALADAVEPGRTGFLVGDVDGMAAAIGRSEEIDPEACRDVARRRFSQSVMASDYISLYGELIRRAARLHPAEASA